MLQFIYQDLSPQDRKEVMERELRPERITYDRHLTDAEIDKESKELAELVKNTAQIEEEKRIAVKNFSDQIKALKEQAQDIADVLMRGTKEVTEKCYKVLNLDTREVGFYNADGELVRVRKAQDADLQMDMFSGNYGQQEAGNLALPQAALPAPVEDVESEEVTDDEDDDELPFL